MGCKSLVKVCSVACDADLIEKISLSKTPINELTQKLIVEERFLIEANCLKTLFIGQGFNVYI